MKERKIDLKEVYLYLKDFLDDDLYVYASSLSFYTIFTFIPMLFLVFTIFTTLPEFNVFYVQLKSFLFDNIIPTNKDIITTYLDTFLSNTDHVSIYGTIYLVVATGIFFHNYEFIISKIFNCKPRRLLNSMSIYFGMFLIIPFGIFGSFYISNYLQNVLEHNSYTSSINLLMIVPFLIIWTIFYIAYRYSAEVRVPKRAAVISSLVSSSIWMVAKNIFIQYALVNKTYLTIYGSFSTLLFFLLWIYVSWIIFLNGLKLSRRLRIRFLKEQT